MQAPKFLNVLNQPLSLEQVPFYNSPLRARLTPAGCGFLGLMLCGFLMSINFSNNLIFAMTFLLAGIALVGWWQTRANLRGLDFGKWRCNPVFAGQKVVYTLAVKNSLQQGCYGLRGVSSDSKTDQETSIPTVDQAELTLQRSSGSRGLLQSIPAFLCSVFPLGLFQGRLHTGVLPECLIYPSPKGEEPLPDQQSGQQAHQRRESGSFTDIRRYAPGDSPSRIAWQALARTDELYTKEFDGAQGYPALWLCWDNVAAPGVEQKLSQLCRWVLDAHRQDREYGLELPGFRISPAKEEIHQRLCLRALALYGAKDQV
jgi:uncharacterized protein (DUF58 family)